MDGRGTHYLKRPSAKPPGPGFGTAPGREISGVFLESPLRAKNAIKQVLSRYGALLRGALRGALRGGLWVFVMRSYHSRSGLGLGELDSL